MKYKIKLSNKYILLIVTIVCIALIIVSSHFSSRETIIKKVIGYVVTPIQKGLTSADDWLSDTINSIKKLKELEEDNKILSKELNKLRYENKILQQDKVEFNRLRKLYKLDQKYAEYPKIGAQVIGKSPGNWYNIFTIDKGSNDGLKPFMVVLAGNGLVGHIIEVGPNYSKVQSIIDDTSSVSSKILRTSDTLFVNGDTKLKEEGLCKIEFIDDEAEIVVGDEVVTSYLGDVYPPGIMIGVIKEIKKDPHKITKFAYLEPVVDFKHLEEVLVINKLWKGKINTGGNCN